MIQKEVLEEKMEDYRQAGAAPQSEPERQYYFMARASGTGSRYGRKAWQKAHVLCGYLLAVR